MFLTSLAVSMALYTVEPIITVYITQLSYSGSHVALAGRVDVLGFGSGEHRLRAKAGKAL